MKKIYIQPSMTIGSMNTFEMIAGGQSWKLHENDWKGDGFTGPGFGTDGGDGTGDGAPAVKRRGFYSSYGDEAKW